MWRRISVHLQSVSPWRSVLKQNNVIIRPNQRLINSASSSSATIFPFHRTAPLFSQHATSDSDTILSKGKKAVEDVMPIATGHEREEIEAELQGRNLQEMDYPEGPFGTKEAPAIIKSTYDKRIVGCPGGEGEDEHDVVWFWLEKGKPHECPVCSQFFMLEVVGPGGSPDGHDDDDHHDHH
ncbi:Cytochrome c oxidase [Macleaya cordata]|uniref:Cytochrome c oxidase n=1 Tax=Macleaya cordata TaxID=56857 RepID=A0A200PQL0_MACCD|nr:Cytochrome c oxidase [Macleaya cordata]